MSTTHQLNKGLTLTMDKIRKIWENEYIKTAIMIILIITIVFGFWYGSQLLLGTQFPALAVASGSMCKPYGMNCDGRSHPFSQTLHIGDLIVIQGIAPKEIKAGPYPDGDIIVFQQAKPSASSLDELIVHRAIYSETNPNNGLIYFKTQGDANSGPDHHNDYRGENYSWNGMISENLLVGKVVLRIPWIGHIALFLHNSSGIFIIVILIVILVIVEFIVPLFSGEKAEVEQRAETERIAKT